jgi:thymidine phosphorylase
MSKKLAEGLEALVLDVKFGSGAFMKTLDKARELARSLEQTGERMGVATRAVLTDMNQPLGRLIGNAVEVAESIDALKGEGPDDVMQVTLALGAELLQSAKAAGTPEEAKAQLEATIESGRAMEVFQKMVQAQGGDLSGITAAKAGRDIAVNFAGYVSAIDTEKLGWAVIELGGGRRKLTDTIDHAVGLEMLVRVGDGVSEGQPWVRVLSDHSSRRTQSAIDFLANAITISPNPVEPLPLIVSE